MTAGILLGAVVSTIAAAQGLGGSFSMTMGGTDGKSTQQPQASSTLIVVPASVVVDPKTRTAAVKLINHGNDTARVDFTVKTDSVAKQSLASWIKDLPKQVVLVPHEPRTVTLHLEVPSGLAAGDYSANLVVSGQNMELMYHVASAQKSP